MRNWLGLLVALITFAPSSARPPEKWADPALPVAGVLLVAVPLLAGLALPAAAAAPDPDTATPDGSFARYPLLALPLGAALVAAASHPITAGRFGTLSWALARLAVLCGACARWPTWAVLRQS